MPSIVPSLSCIRRKAGLSQRALAQLIGVTEMSVSNYESGRNGPTTRVLVAIAEALNVTIDDLMKPPPDRA